MIRVHIHAHAHHRSAGDRAGTAGACSLVRESAMRGHAMMTNPAARLSGSGSPPVHCPLPIASPLCESLFSGAIRVIVVIRPLSNPGAPSSAWSSSQPGCSQLSAASHRQARPLYSALPCWVDCNCITPYWLLCPAVGVGLCAMGSTAEICFGYPPIGCRLLT